MNKTQPLLLNGEYYFTVLFRAFGLNEKRIIEQDNDERFARKELSQLPVSVILGYLKNTHHNILHKTLPEMEQNVDHLLNYHNQSHPFTILLCKLFMYYKQHLIEHIQQEETKLFPYIETLLNAEQVSTKNETGNRYIELFEQLRQYSIQRFSEEHTDMEKELTEIRQLIMRLSPADDRPFPYCLFLTQLKEFEMNLRRHAWLEDEVLVPKARNLERTLNELLTHSDFRVQKSCFSDEILSEYGR